MIGPSRAEPAEDVEEAARMRRLDCINAQACLAVADRNKWPAFTCGRGCYVEPDHEQRESDRQALLALGTWIRVGR